MSDSEQQTVSGVQVAVPPHCYYCAHATRPACPTCNERSEFKPTADAVRFHS